MPLPPTVELLRPWQWYKNGVIFVPLVFSRTFLVPGNYLNVLLAFFAFCFLSSAVYAWNDVLDASRDREHPKKRNRPVARGAVTPLAGVVLGALCLFVGFGLLLLTNPPTMLVGAIFLLFQMAYNLFLKHQVIWDVLLIGAGFVLRALAGTTVIGVEATVWLILCTFLLACFLAFGKRRHELLSLHRQGEEAVRIHRPVLGEYSVELVEQMTNVVATLLLASYVLYTALGTTAWMMFTIPFALYGVFRYIFLVKRRNHGDEPELVFRDRPTVANAFAWALTVVLVLLGVPQRLFEWLQSL